MPTRVNVRPAGATRVRPRARPTATPEDGPAPPAQPASQRSPRLAARAGVLRAYGGTRQGEEGWYMHDDSRAVAYFSVSRDGEWRLLFPQFPAAVLDALTAQAARQQGLVLVPTSAALPQPYYVDADAQVYAYQEKPRLRRSGSLTRIAESLSAMTQRRREQRARQRRRRGSAHSIAAVVPSPSAPGWGVGGGGVGGEDESGSAGSADSADSVEEQEEEEDDDDDAWSVREASECSAMSWSSSGSGSSWSSSSGSLKDALDGTRAAAAAAAAAVAPAPAAPAPAPPVPVLQALPGTVQGHGGWYQSRSGRTVGFFDVREADDAWDLLVGPVAADDYQRLLAAASASCALVPCPGATEPCGDGWYMDRGGGMSLWRRVAVPGVGGGAGAAEEAGDGGDWQRERYWQPFDTHPLQQRMASAPLGSSNSKEDGGPEVSVEVCVRGPELAWT